MRGYSKRKDSLHLHHLISRKEGGDHNADNLVTLCASCHRHIETGDIDHAVKKCLKNAKKYYHLDEDLENHDIDYASNLLEEVFNHIKENNIEETEILIKLDDAIEMLALNKNR